MSSFWHFAKQLLHEKTALFWALAFALISAGGLAAGLLSAGPMLAMILNPEDGRSLRNLAVEYNAATPWITVPATVIDVLPTDRYRGVLLVLAGIAFLTLFGAITNFFHQYLSQTVTARAVARIRADAFAGVIHMPLARVMVRGPSEFVARIVRDSAELQRGMIALVSKAVASVLKGLAALIVALWLDPKLTLIAAPTAIIVAIVLRKLGKRIRRGTRGSLKAQEGLLRISTEVLQGLRAVKTSTAEREAMDHFAQLNEESVRHELKVRTARSLSAPVVETLAIFVVLALAAFAVRGILAGSMPLDRFILVLASLGVAGGSLRPLTGLVNEIQAASAPAERMRDVLSEPKETEGDEDRPSLPRHRTSIEFTRVDFTYPGAAQPALREVNLNILHGERIAVVGPNGSGKTTLLGLVPRLLVPDSGRVAIDGDDIASVNLPSLRGQIGVVTQETIIFRGSIARNIALGSPEASREQVIDAAIKAHADSFIRAIPGGYDADILEQGASLSGGQRQRLAIARAILRDPAILLLDEATSQMDAESEAHIQTAMREFCAGRTTLVIAHRLATVIDSDRIVVMDHGRIVDQGRHAELLKRCELYQALTRTQLVGAAGR